MTTETERVISGYAGTAPRTPLVPWTYVARPLGEEDVEIEIECCGICGSDIHTLNSGWGPTHYPVIVGHEIIGKVIAKGAKVENVSLGQRVGVGAQAFACLNKETCADCKNGDNNCCPKRRFTYNAQYPDGHWAQGGYASHIRLQSAFAFPIPANLPSKAAAPLLCAGATVFTPLKRHGIKAGVKVGIVGIGGLGHLALKFANALGGEVTAVSSSASKREESLKLGAHHFIDASNEAEVKAAEHTLDVLLVTSFNPKASWFSYLNYLKTGGTIVLVGLPEENLVIPPFAFVARRLAIVGSIIGSTEEIKEMLEFASKHNITADIRTFPLSECNEAIKMVHENKIRYRAVLESQPVTY